MCVGRDTKFARYTSIGAELNKYLQLIATIITYHYVNQVAYGLPVSKKDHLLLPCRGYSLGMLLSSLHDAQLETCNA